MLYCPRCGMDVSEGHSCPGDFSYPPGSFYDNRRVYQASADLWTSQMFPFLEPYTELHRAFFMSLVPNRKVAAPKLFRGKRTVRIHDIIPPVREGLMVLLRDFVIVWRTDDGEWHKWIIPAGFVTDVASIPLIVQMLFKMRGDGSVRAAALIHDLLYQLKKLLAKVLALFFWHGPSGAWVHDDRPWSKSMMDKFFAKMMKAYGTPLNSLIYTGVHLGGGLAYLRDDDSRFYTAQLYDVPANLRNSWPR